MIDVTKLVIAIIGICVALVTKFVIPWFKSKTTVSQQEVIENIVTVAIYAAQQLYAHVDKEEKKAYAMQNIETSLTNHGIKLSTEEIDTYIEGVLKGIKTSLGDTSEW